MGLVPSTMDANSLEKEMGMPTRLQSVVPLCLWLFSAAVSAATPAQGVGVVKVASGAVFIERGGERVAATVGTRVLSSDRIVTGQDGSVGIAFRDNSLLSSGPDSVLEIERFVFDSTTHEGAFEASLKRGTLSVVSGKIAKQTPGAMQVRTPATVLAVRGTEFAVKTDPGPTCQGPNDE